MPATNTADQSNSGQPGAAAPHEAPATWSAGRIAWIAALLGAIVFVCLNIVSAHIFSNARVDLTEQHLFSLSDGTRTMLGELKEPVRFRLFMSSGLTKQAPQLAAFATRVRALLDSYAAAAKGNIILEVIDPKPFSDEEDRAVAFGIDGFTGSGGERLFFGLAATNSTTGRATIGVFAPDREAFLEYDLTRLVSELGRRGKPVVALIDGMGLAGNPMMRMPEQQVLLQMKQFFDVKPLTGEIEKLPDDTRVLMVVHPQDLSEKTLYTIDQWVIGGNPTMIFVDPVAENQTGPRGGPSPNPTSTLEPLFKAWGVKFDTTRAVGDPDYALQTERTVGGRPVASQNLAWMALRGDALARDEAMLAQLSAIVMTTAGSFETTKDGVTLRPLVQASNAAVTVDATLAGDRTGDPRRLLIGLTKAPKRPILIARLGGTLDSAYPDGIGPKPEDKKPDDKKPEAAKADEKKPEEAKSTEAKSAEAKSAEAGDAKPGSEKSDAARADDGKAAAQTADGKAVADASPAEAKSGEPKSGEPKSGEVTSAEPNPADTKPADAGSAGAAETKAADTKPAETKTGETKAADTKPAEAKPAEPKPTVASIKRSTKPINVILVGDADMLMDRNWIQQHSLFGQQIAQAFANNGDFVINAVEQMAGGAALSDLRGRGVSWRPFEMIQRMEADADSRFRAKEQELTTQLKDTEQKLAQLPKAAEGSAEVMTPEQAKAIEGFRTQLLAIRSELRDVQFALRRDVDNLKTWVTAVNVGVVPVTVGVIALAFGLRRPRRPVPKKPDDASH